MYILDVTLKENKIILLELCTIYGINYYTSQTICKKLGLSKNAKTNQLSKNQIFQLNIILTNEYFSKISNELKKIEYLRFQKLVSIKSYRGLRKIKGLPIRGQRTHTNAKTARKHTFYKELVRSLGKLVGLMPQRLLVRFQLLTFIKKW